MLAKTAARHFGALLDSPPPDPGLLPGPLSLWTPSLLDLPPTAQRQREKERNWERRGREISGPPLRAPSILWAVQPFGAELPSSQPTRTQFGQMRSWTNAVAAFVLRVHGDGVSSVSCFFHCTVVVHLFACNFFTLVVRCATDAASVLSNSTVSHVC